ncbi:energy transducer TonB [Terriglobus saanensis]|uniref:TonB family protein n=1 Tax=Terriglobus saanensis (strain ATCC BAA-1853 / DSM 23119 / SP1PR4) TaxID=401053 RepID=E8V295_TERSS|nr:energy transducer TonB [Terriglobus saanensis]ADV81228.1 TonB family protein [Terriglobus saanensis SP1PR4]
MRRFGILAVLLLTSALQAQDTPTNPAHVPGGVVGGLLVSKVNPVYPQEARRGHILGTVVMHAIISKTGDVEDLTVLSGPEELRQPSLDAVRQWKYRPYLLNGQPTEIDTTITVNFQINNKPKDGSQI